MERDGPAGEDLVAQMRDETPVPFRYRPLGQLVDLRKGSALVDIVGAKVSGRVSVMV